MTAPRRFRLVSSQEDPVVPSPIPAERDERATMGTWAGALALLAAAVAAAGQVVPGVPHDHSAVVWPLVAALALYGAASLKGVIPWSRIPIEWHLVAVLALQPLIAVGIWATGGINSYLTPILALAMLHIAYFFPTRLAWIGVGGVVLAAASPLLYTPVDEDMALARVLAFAVTCEGFTLTLQALKGRLVKAERRQRELAHVDPLTGLGNRRGLDRALTHAIEAAGGSAHGRRAGDTGSQVAVLLADVDDFRYINDRYGRAVGDDVLRRFGEVAARSIRPGDCLARLDADELGLVAAGADERGALRLSTALEEAAAEIQPALGTPPLSITVAWAMYPRDGRDEATLLEVAGQRLHASKGHRPVSSRG